MFLMTFPEWMATRWRSRVLGLWCRIVGAHRRWRPGDRWPPGLCLRCWSVVP